jgi:hypothetical protein
MQGQNTGPEPTDWESTVQANNEAIPAADHPPLIPAPAPKTWLGQFHPSHPATVWTWTKRDGELALMWILGPIAFVLLVWMISAAGDLNAAAVAIYGVLTLFGVWIYALPAIIAHRRGHRNAAAITLLTILLGWTFIGWAIAMVWAHTNDR